MPRFLSKSDWKQAVACLALLSTGACATITKDTTQTISVTTIPASASCHLSNAAGSWDIATTPGTALVKRNYSPLAIRCEQAGQTGTTTLEPKTRGRAYGNILLGGAPAIIDANTGAGYEYAPDSVTVSLSK